MRKYFQKNSLLHVLVRVVAKSKSRRRDDKLHFAHRRLCSSDAQ